MENFNSTNSSDELMHFGRKGMKWYQNIFTKGKNSGSGKKKGSDDDDDESKSKDGKGSSSSVKKSASEMSEAELLSAINHLSLEKRYRDLQKELASDMDSGKVDKGEGFVKGFWEHSVKPGVQEGGKAMIKDMMTNLGKKMLADKAGDAMDVVSMLKKEADIAELKFKKRDNEKKLAALDDDEVNTAKRESVLAGFKKATRESQQKEADAADALDKRAAAKKAEADKQEAAKKAEENKREAARAAEEAKAKAKADAEEAERRRDPSDSFNYYFDGGGKSKTETGKQIVSEKTETKTETVADITPSDVSAGQDFYERFYS